MLSVTDLTTYTFCPRKLYISKILKLKEPIKTIMILGSIKHKLLELFPHIDETTAKNITPTTTLSSVITQHNQHTTRILHQTIIQRKIQLRSTALPLETAFNTAQPILLAHSTQRATQLHTFAHQNNAFEETLWETYTPKEKPEYSLTSEHLQLKGRIDTLRVHPTTITPVEHKSGHPPQEGVWDTHKLQLAAYALLLEDHFNTTIPYGIINYIDAQQEIILHINHFLKDDVKQCIANVNNTLQQPQPPPVINNISKCKSCGYYAYCYQQTAEKP